MKKLMVLITFLLLVDVCGNVQDIVKQAPPGFDVSRSDIPHGKIDLIHYPSLSLLC